MTALEAALYSATRMARRDELIDLLSEPRATRVLKDEIAGLFVEWTTIAMREFPALPAGARETAFAVVVEWLARQVQKGRLDASTLDGLAKARLTRALVDQRDREQRHGGNFARRCARWLPERIELHDRDGSTRSVTPTHEEMIASLWRAASGVMGPDDQDILCAFRDRWRRAAATKWAQLRTDDRDDAIQEAWSRLVHPLTAASLTQANLARRARDIAIGPLKAAAKAGNRRNRFKDIDSIELANGWEAEDAVEAAFGVRLRSELKNVVYRLFPWMRDRIERRDDWQTIEQRHGATPGSLKKTASRLKKFLETVGTTLERTGLRRDARVRDALAQLDRKWQLASDVRNALADAIDKVLTSDLIRILLPVPLLRPLERIVARLRNQDGGGDEQGGRAVGGL